MQATTVRHRAPAPRLLLGLAAGLLGLFFVARAEPSLAGGCNTCKPTPPPKPCCVAPPPKTPCCAPPVKPNPPPRPHGPDIKPMIKVPSINVYVAPSVIVNASANAKVSAEANAYGQSQALSGAGAFNYGNVVYGGGGGGGFFASPGASSFIGGLDVDAGKEKVTKTAYQATRSKTVKVVIRAVCIDDRSVPHPASQVEPGEEVYGGYDGELFRCIAGSWLQATWYEWRAGLDYASYGQSWTGGMPGGCIPGPASYGPDGQLIIGGGGTCSPGQGGGSGGGSVITCRKGESLYHAPGGNLACRPQRPARDCNERSLLRRYGAGVKVLTMVTTETYTAYREETSTESSSSSASMSIALDGGVGGIVY